jgi:hypothetical protein
MKYLLRVRPAVAMMPGMTAELLRRHGSYIADLAWLADSSDRF